MAARRATTTVKVESAASCTRRAAAATVGRDSMAEGTASRSGVGDGLGVAVRFLRAWYAS